MKESKSFTALLAIALALALIVDNVRWGKNFFRSGFYIPVLISGIVSGFIWKIMYNYNFGTFNAVLGSLGLDKWKQDWLGNSALTLLMIGVVLIWKERTFPSRVSGQNNHTTSFRSPSSSAARTASSVSSGVIF